MIERYRHDDAELVFGQDFISVDPGKDGACIVYVNNVPVEVIPTALDPVMIADAMQRHGVSVMLMERQFVKLNPMSAIELCWMTGMMIGAVANELGGILHMVEVFPSTWQARQRKAMKIEGKLNRKQGIELSITCAEIYLNQIWDTQVAQHKKAVIEGISSAAGIAAWWMSEQVVKPTNKE